MELERNELARVRSMEGQGRDPDRAPMTAGDLAWAVGLTVGAWALVPVLARVLAPVLDWLAGVR